jgi:pimeloyl-ACP methyl ester carboxylesterase
VLVPGLDGTAQLFYRQVPLLSRRFDTRRYPLPDDPTATMDDLVAGLVGYADAIPGPVVLCGESFGGALSLASALRRPGSVQGVVMVNSFPWLDQRLRLWLAPRLLRLLPWAAMPLVRRYTEARIHSPHADAADLREFHERCGAIGRSGYIRRLELLQTFDVRDRLGELRPPALFLAGDRDRLLPSVYWATYMAGQVPRGEARVLEGFGHVCLINHDLDLLDHIGPWWDRATRTPDVDPDAG